MDLPVVHSQEHNDELAAAAGGEEIWLGANQIENYDIYSQIGDWKWGDGSTFSIELWDAFPRTGEVFLEMTPTGEWSDGPSEERNAYFW
jgi:hypothetical protein